MPADTPAPADAERLAKIQRRWLRQYQGNFSVSDMGVVQRALGVATQERDEARAEIAQLRTLLDEREADIVRLKQSLRAARGEVFQQLEARRRLGDPELAAIAHIPQDEREAEVARLRGAVDGWAKRLASDLIAAGEIETQGLREPSGSAVEQATAMVSRWEHGAEEHRKWLRDMCIPEVAVALDHAAQSSREAALGEAEDWLRTAAQAAENEAHAYAFALAANAMRNLVATPTQEDPNNEG